MSTLPATVEAVYPLTPTQRGLLFHSLYAPASGVYFVQLAFELRGPLDRRAFDAAWQALAQRHAVLRTAFAWDRLDAPLQVVGRQVRLPVTHAETSELSPEALDAWLRADRQRGFDLRRAPLARVHCTRLAAERHRVVFSHHHLLLDGWSLPILLRDWQAFYGAAQDDARFKSAIDAPIDAGADLEAFAQGPLQALLPPAPTYRDHVDWLAQQDGATAGAFWRTLLADFDTPSTPGFVRAPRAGAPTSALTALTAADAAAVAHDSAPPTLRCVLDAAQTQSLQQLARRLRVTLGTVLQGAWALLLARSSGSTDVVYGLTRAGRPASRPEAAATVGLFITTLPVRTPLPSGLPLADWLPALQARVLAQQAHEHMAPADVQRAAGVPAGQALFDSVVVIENYPGGLSAPDAALQVADVQVFEATHYALSLYAVLGPSIELRLLTDAQRVGTADAARCLAALQRLLRQFTESPSQALGRFELVGDADIAALRAADRRAQQSLPQWLAPAAIAAMADASPTADALVDAEGVLDRAGLQALTDRIAARLAAQGVRSGDRVGVCLLRGREMVAALPAAWRLGAAYVPMDAGYPPARLRQMAEDAGLRTLLLHADTREALAWWQGPRCDLDVDAAQRAGDATKLNSAWPTASASASAGAAAQAHAPLPAPLSPHTAAYVIYTSGSTGTPKGVTITHGNLANLLEAMNQRIDLQPDARWLAVTTLSFDIAALELFGPLVAGACVVLASEAQLRDGERLSALLAHQRIGVLQATPSTWRLLLAAGWSGHSGMTLLCGGEALERALARRLLVGGAALWNVYGPTETTVWSAALRVTAALVEEADQDEATSSEAGSSEPGITDAGRSDIGSKTRPVPIGGPLDNTRLRVLDADLRLLPPGVPGELCIGGAGVSPGYHRRAGLSAERFVPDPLALPGDAHGVLYRTGDLVIWREDGLIDFLGRLDHQTKLRGQRIELGEVEAALSACPGVQQAVAVVEGEGAAARLVAYVVGTSVVPSGGMAAAAVGDGQAEDAAEVWRTQLASRLPAAMLPAAIHRLSALPLTPNGKIDRRALRPPPRAAAAVAPGLATPLESRLLALWQELLQQPGLGLHDSFFAAGGHSLLLVTLQSRLRHDFGHELPLVELFNHPTVASLAERLQRAPGASATSATPGTESDSRAAGRARLLQRRRAATESIAR